MALAAGIQKPTPVRDSLGSVLPSIRKLWRCLDNGLSFCGKSQFPQETRQKPSQQNHCFVEWLPMPAPLFMKTISLKRGESLKSMASLQKGKQCFKRSLYKLQNSEDYSTNVLIPKGYHPTTYLDWMALGFQSSAADMSHLNGHVVACTWDTLSSSLSQLSASQFTTTFKKQHKGEG